MNKYITAVFIAFNLAAHTDYLDDLFRMHSDVTEILPAIHANKIRSVQELANLQRRALRYYRSPSAYEQILMQGLRHNDDAYKRSTCELLINTFHVYLSFTPRPDLDNLLRLIAPNGEFSIEELILLNRKSLLVFPESDAYPKILASGLSSSHQDYKRATVKLLVDSFQDYLNLSPPPLLSDALALTKPNSVSSLEELLILQKLIYAAYPEVENILLIVDNAFRSSHAKYRAASLSLAIKYLGSAFENGQRGTELIQIFMALWDRGADSVATLVQLENAFSIILNSDKTNEEILAIITPRDRTKWPPFFMTARQNLVKQRPDALEQVLVDCEKMPPTLVQACKILVKQIQPGLDALDVYQILAILRTSGFEKNSVYHEYQKQLESTVMARLKEEVGPYFVDDEKLFFNEIESAINEKIIADVKEECSICLRDLSTDDMYTLQNCQHVFCKDCLKQYVSTQLNDGAKKIVCPSRDCSKSLSAVDLAALGFADTISQIAKNILQEKIQQVPNAYLCPNEYCQDAIIPHLDDPFIKLEERSLQEGPKFSQKFLHFFSKNKNSATNAIEDTHHTCRSCGYTYCKQCLKNHPSKMSCKKFTKRQKATKRGEKQVLSGKNKHFKPCPLCKVIIEKHEGCNHMLCTNCHHRFFWSSLKEIH